MKTILSLLARGTILLMASGGKDSAVASHYAVQRIREVDGSASIIMVHARTPLTLDENVEYVERLAEFLGVELAVVEPEKGRGLEKIVDWGLPHPRGRWCMVHWKVRPIIDHIRRSSYRPPYTNVLGVRKSESRRRLTIYSGVSDKPYLTEIEGLKMYNWLPIVDWDEHTVWRYIERHNIPRNPLWGARGHSSHDCVVCLPYASFLEYAWLKANHPDVWRKIYSVYKELNSNRRRERKILAWRYTDLDEVERMQSLENFIYRAPRLKCRECLAPGGGDG